MPMQAARQLVMCQRFVEAAHRENWFSVPLIRMLMLVDGHEPVKRANRGAAEPKPWRIDCGLLSRLAVVLGALFSGRCPGCIIRAFGQKATGFTHSTERTCLVRYHSRLSGAAIGARGNPSFAA
jgi:hypothetical protein